MPSFEDYLTRYTELLSRGEPFVSVTLAAATLGLVRLARAPTELVIDGPWIKVTIALARGKHLHDKRETLRRRTRGVNVQQISRTICVD